VNEICALLGSYAAQNGNPVPTFRDNLSFPHWDGIGCTETPVRDYRSKLRKIPEDHKFESHHCDKTGRSVGRGLLSVITLFSFCGFTPISISKRRWQAVPCFGCLTFRHRASCILGLTFHYSPENAFYIFNQQIYFIIWHLLDRASLI